MADKEININEEPILIHYWDTIRERLHEESGLKYPHNTVGGLLEIFFNYMLRQEHEDLEEIVDQGFLITCSGLYLDIRGNEMGIPRRPGKHARGQVQFTLVNPIPLNSEPTIIETPEINGTVFDYTYKEVQDIIQELNEEIKEKNSDTHIYEMREATSDVTIPKGTKVYSDTGFEYHTLYDGVIPKGKSILIADVASDETGLRYNTGPKTIVASNLDNINEEILVTNVKAIIDGTDGEEDSDYRRRLLNNVTVNTSVNYLKRQSIIIYSQVSITADVRLKVTSFNPYLNNSYVAIPPNDNPDVTVFIEEELIANKNLVPYKRGW